MTAKTSAPLGEAASRFPKRERCVSGRCPTHRHLMFESQKKIAKRVETNSRNPGVALAKLRLAVVNQPQRRYLIFAPFESQNFQADCILVRKN